MPGWGLAIWGMVDGVWCDLQDKVLSMPTTLNGTTHLRIYNGTVSCQCTNERMSHSLTEK